MVASESSAGQCPPRATSPRQPSRLITHARTAQHAPPIFPCPSLALALPQLRKPLLHHLHQLRPDLVARLPRQRHQDRRLLALGPDGHLDAAVVLQQRVVLLVERVQASLEDFLGSGQQVSERRDLGGTGRGGRRTGVSSGRLVRGSPVMSSLPATLGRVAGKSVLYDRFEGAWIHRAGKARVRRRSARRSAAFKGQARTGGPGRRHRARERRRAHLRCGRG